jgi:hypothetical protein
MRRRERRWPRAPAPLRARRGRTRRRVARCLGELAPLLAALESDAGDARA